MILQRVRQKRGLQLFLGAAVGIVFGFLLQRGQVTKYEIIVGQLLLRDFTVMKIMLTAIITGMLGIFFLSRLGLVNYHIQTGSLGTTVPGGGEPPPGATVPGTPPPQGTTSGGATSGGAYPPVPGAPAGGDGRVPSSATDTSEGGDACECRSGRPGPATLGLSIGFLLAFRRSRVTRPAHRRRVESS